MTRQLLGISGRSGQPSANVFEYKAAQLERPIEAESVSIVPGQITPIQAVGRNPDGTLKSVQQRTLTIATPEGERILVFPRAWGANQLRDAAAARGLLGGKVIKAHAAPPETATEFVAASLDVIREVFGPGHIDIYQTRLDAPVGETEYRRVRFNISRAYVRAIAKLAFHYFLWTCPWIGGDESEFEGIRRFVHDGNGEEREFLQRHDCLVRARIREEVAVSDRKRLVQHGKRLEYFTIGWNCLETVAALISGLIAGSIALVGFGLDSLIEVASGTALLWRLRRDQNIAARENAERLTLRVVGLCFLLLSAYLAYESLDSLITRQAPRRSVPGLIIAAASLVTMPLLARAKRRVSAGIGSAAMAADARQADFCLYLSAILLAGLALNALFGLWWTDPAAALVMIPIIAREGIRAWKGKTCCGACEGH